MSNTRKTAGKTAAAGKTATNMNTATRTDRWRRLAEERIARLEELHYPGFALLRTCAEIEGMTPDDLIVDRLEAERYGGRVVESEPSDFSTPDYTARRNAYVDTDYELNAPTRTRNNHEREIVNGMEFHFTFLNIPDHVLKDRGRAFLLRFYRKGDVGLHPAVDRMTESALSALDCA